MNKKFDLTQNVVKEIENLVKVYELDYIDAVLHYAERVGIEIEVLADIINSNEGLKSKIQLEAENLHFLKSINRLPL